MRVNCHHGEDDNRNHIIYNFKQQQNTCIYSYEGYIDALWLLEIEPLQDKG